MVTGDDETQLASNTRLLVAAAKIGPVGLFVPLLDRFPQLGNTRPEDWDFFLCVAGVFEGIAQYQALGSSPDSKRTVRTIATEELLKWYPEGPDALLDCERFVVGSVDSLLQDGEIDFPHALSMAIGLWVCWNVLRRAPEGDSDSELASALGRLALKITEGCWG